MRSLDTTTNSAYPVSSSQNTVQPQDFFLDSCLTTDDAVAFAKTVQICLDTLGRERCWCMKKRKHSAFAGFVTSHNRKPLYRNQDARPFILALSGRFYSDEKPILVRRSCCSSVHCINPSHYYYGTRADVALESQAKTPKATKKQNQVTPEVVAAIKTEHSSGEMILKLSRKYKLSYHVTRRICSENAYASNNADRDLDSIWEKTIENCRIICKNNPNASRAYNLAYYVSENLECPWHRPGFPGHKGNFGLMGECLDCMEEIQKGRCTVDVTQFSMDWYWQIKRFWEQVDIRGEDECWPWLGTTRRGKSESIAYFPSPFHSGKTQSAPRVAFWLSRGYTGKYKVFSQTTCEPFCTNPRHLRIREFKDMLPPAKIEKIQLHFGNVFDQYRKNLSQMQPGSGE
jgi:hypothetical protein